MIIFLLALAGVATLIAGLNFAAVVLFSVAGGLALWALLVYAIVGKVALTGYKKAKKDLNQEIAQDLFKFRREFDHRNRG